MTKQTKNILWVLGSLVLLGLLFLGFRNPGGGDADLVSRTGVHYHPHLSIFIHGEEQEIPANIGLLGAHSPVHTHEADGVIHQEFEGLVREDNLKLDRFFKIWGKTFNSQCIFEFCGGDEGTLRMFVDGEENFEFENFVMGDGDRIEIRYE